MKNKVLVKFNKIATLIVLFSALIQNLIFFSFENLFASFVLIYGWLLIKSVVLTSYNLKIYPVSFLMILGLSIFHFLLPMPLTLLEFKPVIYNLNVPFLTFFHQFLFVTTIVFTHKIYTHISRGKNLFRSVLIKTDFYRVPSNKLIWTTGILGLLATFYLYFIFGQWEKEVSDRNFMSYLANILAPYLWMPILLIFSKYRSIRNIKQNILKSNTKFIVFYSLLVIVISIVSNWRTVMFSGVLFFIILLFLGILLGYYKIQEFLSLKKIILIFTVIYFVFGPMIDLGYAMVIVRGERTKLTSSELLYKTINVYMDKETLDKAKIIGSSFLSNKLKKNNDWDEKYLNNIIINRFVNLKISDNCVYYATKIGYQNKQMKNELINQVEAFMPNILLGVFNIDPVKKNETLSYSIGDYLYSKAINDSTVRGSFVISSMPGVGLAIFGYWYLLIIIPLFIIIFAMFDSFVVRQNGKLIFSYLFFLLLVLSVNYFNDRHVFTYEIRFIFRTYFESVIVFIIYMKIMRVIFLILKSNAKKSKIKTEFYENK